jgi:hypothetical protein
MEEYPWKCLDILQNMQLRMNVLFKNLVLNSDYLQPVEGKAEQPMYHY